MQDRSTWRWDVGVYLAITFGITWSVAVAAIGFSSWFQARFGPLSAHAPAFYFAVWAPNIAAVVLTLTRGGFTSLLTAFGRWRVPLIWWLIALLLYPLLVLIAQLIEIALHNPVAPLSAWQLVIPAIFNVAALLLGPIGEELGWRGYLLPRFIERFGAPVAAIGVGIIWMIWHIPAFLVSGLPQSSMSFGIFFLGGVALSVFMTWIYIRTRGSVLLAGVVFHTIVNACGALGPMTPIQTAVLVTAAIALLATTRLSFARA
jgi:membrane protease YdiL (CAAX protease family)